MSTELHCVAIAVFFYIIEKSSDIVELVTIEEDKSPFSDAASSAGVEGHTQAAPEGVSTDSDILETLPPTAVPTGDCIAPPTETANDTNKTQVSSL